MEDRLDGVICLVGNDGTGKSTLLDLLNKAHPNYAVI
jgi:ABC-type cobalamin/Fe3+-siderophores transport system ATPase subunit